MTDLYLTRRIFTFNSTIGKLILGDWECWTLEDSARKKKVFGLTCIPSGTYSLEIRESNHFKKPMPFLMDVPFYEGIMIHPGDTPPETNGCILVGLDHNAEDTIGQSVKAFDILFPRLQSGMKIHIAGGYSKEEFQNQV